MSLYKHQEDAVKFAVANNGNAFLWHDPGCGKTRTSLEVFSFYKGHVDPSLKMLVVCPLSLINAAWGADTKKFTSYKYAKYGEQNVLTDIIGINFESLIQAKRLKEVEGMLKAGNWMLVVDESSRMKNPKAQTTKALLRLAPLAKHRLVASGTPCPNNETELWAQAKFVDPKCFNDSFFAFRNAYFHLGRNGAKQWMPSNGARINRMVMQKLFQQGWKYEITEENRVKMMDRIKPFCHRVKKEEALDLPEKIDEIRQIVLNPAEKKVYLDMKRHLVAEIEKEGRTELITAEVALAKLMKLRQATAGFMYNEKHEAIPVGNSKLNELENVLEELGDQQVIIWVQFHEEIRAISEMLEKKGKSFVTLYAGTEQKDDSIVSFQSSKAQYLIAHPKSAGHGLTFVNCSTAVFLSVDYSYESHSQARDRIHRIGQNKKCLYIYILAKDTIDESVMKILDRKQSLQDVVYEIMKEAK